MLVFSLLLPLYQMFFPNDRAILSLYLSCHVWLLLLDVSYIPCFSLIDVTRCNLCPVCPWGVAVISGRATTSKEVVLRTALLRCFVTVAFWCKTRGKSSIRTPSEIQALVMWLRVQWVSMRYLSHDIEWFGAGRIDGDWKPFGTSNDESLVLGLDDSMRFWWLP